MLFWPAAQLCVLYSLWSLLGCMDVTTALWHFEKAKYRISHLLPPPSAHHLFPQSCSPASTEVKSSGTTITAASCCLQDASSQRTDTSARQVRQREARPRVSTAKGDTWCVMYMLQKVTLYSSEEGAVDCDFEGKCVDRMVYTVFKVSLWVDVTVWCPESLREESHPLAWSKKEGSNTTAISDCHLTETFLLWFLSSRLWFLSSVRLRTRLCTVTYFLIVFCISVLQLTKLWLEMLLQQQNIAVYGILVPASPFLAGLFEI